METTKRDIYEDNEELELLVDFGKEGSKMFLPAGTVVRHVKTIDTDDLTKSIVFASYKDPATNEDRAVVVRETDVKPVKVKTLKNAFNDFNKAMMQANPELRIYHPNIILRYYYRTYYFFKRLFNRG